MKLNIHLALCLLIINPLYSAQPTTPSLLENKEIQQTQEQQKKEPTFTQKVEQLWEKSKTYLATIVTAIALARALSRAPTLEEQKPFQQKIIHFPVPTKQRPNFVTLITVFAAVRNGRLHILRHYIEEHHENPNMTDDNGNTLLMAAAASGNTNIARYLLSNPYVNIEARNKNNDTALIIAVRDLQPQIVKDLLIAGANSYATNTQGQSAYTISVNNQVIRDLIINRSYLRKEVPQWLQIRRAHGY